MMQRNMPQRRRGSGKMVVALAMAIVLAAGSSNVVFADVKGRYGQKGGYKAAAAQRKNQDVYYSGLRQTLDSMVLVPQSFPQFPELDSLLDYILAYITTPDMDTHDKLLACYDYLINNTEYGLNIYFGDALDMTYGVLTGGIGVCNDYAAAFTVMAWKIGVPMYQVGGMTHASNGNFTPHSWCQLNVGTTTYIFDPQVEDAIAGRQGGNIMHIRFGGTTLQLADKYADAFLMDCLEYYIY